MKKAVLKLISCLLTLTLLFSFIPTSGIYANAASSQLEVIKEAKEDYSSGSPAGDWGTAIYKDGLYWGFFHNAVQNHIRSKDDDMEKHELPITYKNGKKEELIYGKELAITHIYGNLNHYLMRFRQNCIQQFHNYQDM